MIKRFVLAHGLPGSGKTTLLTRLYNEEIKNGKEAIYVNVDPFMKKGYETAFSDAWWIAYNAKSKNDFMWNPEHDDTTFYIDALCTTEDNIACLVKVITDRFTKTFGNWFEYQFTIYDFNEDREHCLQNDRLREEIDPARSAKITIARASYSPLDESKLNELIENKISNKRVEFITEIIPAKVWCYDESTEEEKLKSKIMAAAGLCGGTVEAGILYGEAWTVGGEEWNYKGDTWSVGSEKPRDFEEFDKLLEYVWPDISFLVYKKLREKLCTINEFHESDYYESYDRQQWQVSIDDLTNEILKYKK